MALLLLLVQLLLMSRNLLDQNLLWLCLPGVGLALVGLWDDLHELGIRLRLVLQVLAVSGALVMAGTMPGLPFPGWELSDPWLLLLLLLPGWVWLINLYNFMDGIDGLAAAEAVFVALALAWFALDAGLHGSSLLLLGLAAILGGFLCFNWAPARLFMGDAGSNFLGYVLVACGLQLAQAGALTVWTLLILLGVFIVDSTLTLLKRMWSGALWYHGHRYHAYQICARVRGSHADVVLAVSAINACWLLPLGVLSVHWPEYGAGIALVAWAPLVLLVHRCQLRFIGSRLP